MKKCVLFLLVLALPHSDSNQFKLEKQWETEQSLKMPESVIYDVTRKVLYVSNINLSPLKKDGNGFISRVKLNGEIEDLEWITGLNGPKGLGIFENRLYVADIDELVEIDITSGQILNKYLAPGAVILNDVAIDLSGNVYISDSSRRNSVIYKFSNGKVEEWIRSEQIKKPNGLYAQKDELIVGNSGDGGLKAISFSDKKISTIARVSSSIDGLKADQENNYIISDWRGKTSLITQSGRIIELLNTTDDKINSADIEYIKDKNLLIIPTFYDNRLMAYRLVRR